jgi:hypothetical protein
MTAQTAQVRLNGSGRVSAKFQTPDELAASLGMSANLQQIRARQKAAKDARIARHAYSVVAQGAKV